MKAALIVGTMAFVLFMEVTITATPAIAMGRCYGECAGWCAKHSKDRAACQAKCEAKHCT
jgi:hypothetical protein